MVSQAQTPIVVKKKTGIPFDRFNEDLSTVDPSGVRALSQRSEQSNGSQRSHYSARSRGSVGILGSSNLTQKELDKLERLQLEDKTKHLKVLKAEELKSCLSLRSIRNRIVPPKKAGKKKEK